jgi:hypothetical protein
MSEISLVLREATSTRYYIGGIEVNKLYSKPLMPTSWRSK